MAKYTTRYVGRLSPEFALLGFLTEQPGYGYELHQRLATELGFVWHISQSQSYNILKRLEAQGFVISNKVEQEKLPPRQMLYLTTIGRQRFEAWLHAPTSSSVHAMRLEFITRLYFVQRAGGSKEIQTMLDEQTITTGVNIARLEHSLENVPAEQIFNRLGLELRIKQLKSLLEWLDDCRKLFQQAHNQPERIQK
jgi:PadR family transcriptional regulator, regulatory protein AphA